MRFFALRVTPGAPTIQTMASGRAEALANFEKVLGHPLTDEATGQMSDYTLDEWDDPAAHLVNPTIQIWKRR